MQDREEDNGAPRLTPERLDAALALRVVLHCAGSVRGLVGDDAWRRGIRVTSAADTNAIPVAEYILAAIIFAGKKIPFLAADERLAYEGWGRVTGYGDLSNFAQTVGIVGFSRIGRKVVELLKVLDDTTCLVADPYADPAEVAAAGATLVELRELLPRVDVLSLHAPELQETRHLIGAEQLRLLPDHATVINTARGSLADSDALAAECASGRLFAILDVTDPEPLPASSPLRRLAQVVVTPACGGVARFGDRASHRPHPRRAGPVARAAAAAGRGHRGVLGPRTECLSRCLPCARHRRRYAP
ncbi:hydroxyacid dehydrogenase [Streptomyces nodosus]